MVVHWLTSSNSSVLNFVYIVLILIIAIAGTVYYMQSRTMISDGPTGEAQGCLNVFITMGIVSIGIVTLGAYAIAWCIDFVIDHWIWFAIPIGIIYFLATKAENENSEANVDATKPNNDSELDLLPKAQMQGNNTNIFEVDNAIDDGNNTDMPETLGKEAKKEDADAQWELATVYNSQNDSKAIYWYEEAGNNACMRRLIKEVERGNIYALQGLKNIAENSENKDTLAYQDARRWLKCSIEESDILEWFEKVAKKGDVEAQNALIQTYSHGALKDDKKLVYWVKISAEQGNELAKGIMGEWRSHNIKI